MADIGPPPSDFYTGLVADLYRALRSETPDPTTYARFIELAGQPALELGCGDGDPLLDLRARGIDIEGLDSSADMLDRCRARAAVRGIDVVVHRATFETMTLATRYRSIFLAGATFNLLPDDGAAEQALERIAGHLEPGGSALVPLMIPDAGEPPVGSIRELTAPGGRVMRMTVLSVDRDPVARVQTAMLRYESVAAGQVEVVDRAWLLHWIGQEQFSQMARRAGLTVEAVFAPDGSPASPSDRTFAFWLRLGTPPQRRSEAWTVARQQSQL